MTDTQIKVTAYRTVQQRYECYMDVPNGQYAHVAVDAHMLDVGDGEWIDQEVDEQNYTIHGEFS